MKVARIYLRLSTDKQALSRQTDIEVGAKAIDIAGRLSREGRGICAVCQECRCDPFLYS